MSQQLINRSLDLKKLRDDGYHIEVRSNLLLVKDVPYVNSERLVKRGTLVSELTLAMGDKTTTPGSHQMYFVGEHPCNADGSKLEQIVFDSVRRELAPGITVDHWFSSKPLTGNYVDYYEKVIKYIAIITGEARAIQSSVTAQTYPLLIDDESTESVFHYSDSATSRAGIGMVTHKLENHKIALVGVGGTGSYVLDLVAKTPAREIHLFDGDDFLQHNAFRAPGAPKKDQFNVGEENHVRAPTKKVDYLHGIYSNMHRGIHPHPIFMGAENVEELRGMDFVFLCMDSGETKRIVVEALELFGVSFVDVGMGIDMVGDSLRGIVRATTSTPSQRSHFRDHVSLSDAIHNGDYDLNIQIADLNALNAALAVIRWKKLCGFYVDYKCEHHSTYTINTNLLLSEESVCQAA